MDPAYGALLAQFPKAVADIIIGYMAKFDEDFTHGPDYYLTYAEGCRITFSEKILYGQWATGKIAETKEFGIPELLNEKNYAAMYENMTWFMVPEDDQDVKKFKSRFSEIMDEFRNRVIYQDNDLL